MIVPSRSIALAIAILFAVGVCILLIFIPASGSQIGYTTTEDIGDYRRSSFRGRRVQVEGGFDESRRWEPEPKFEPTSDLEPEPEVEMQMQEKSNFTEVCHKCHCAGEELNHETIMVGGGPSFLEEGMFYANLEVIHSVERCYEAVRKHKGCGKSHFRYSKSSNGFSNCKCYKPCASRCTQEWYTEEDSWTSILVAMEEGGPDKDDAACFEVAGRCTDTIDFSRDVRDVAFAAFRTDPNSADAKLIWNGKKTVRYDGPYYEWHDVPSKPRIREVCRNVKELGFCDTTDGRIGCRETCGRCERKVGNDESVARQKSKKETKVAARENKREEKNSERDAKKEEKKSFKKELREDRKQFYDNLDALVGRWEEVDATCSSEKDFRVSLEFTYSRCDEEGHYCGEYRYAGKWQHGELQLRTDPTCSAQSGKEVCRYEFNTCYRTTWGNKPCSSTGEWMELVVKENAEATWIQHSLDQDEPLSCIMEKTGGEGTLTRREEEKRARAWELYKKQLAKQRDQEDGEGPWVGEEPRPCMDWWPMGDKPTKEACADYKADGSCNFQNPGDLFNLCRKTCGECS